MLIARRYRLQDKIGAGGMGTVFRGEDTLTGQPVAIKQLNAAVLTTGPDIMTRFQREGEALRQLNHPGIVRLLDAVQVEGSHYLITEYVSGGDLGDLLKKGRLTIQRVLEIALDVADALTRAHRLGIIHRDLKPANVLMAGDGTPRLSDFGVAYLKSAERLTDTGAAVGTMDYLPPESLSGEAVDARADIWSFGVMLFEMLTRQRPFTRDTFAATMFAIMRDAPPDLEKLRVDAPAGLVDLVYRMLVKDRHGRIASVRQVGADLENLLNTLTTRSPAPIPVARDFAPVTPVTPPVRHNLLAATTPFIGRETEMNELRRLLTDDTVRLVTVVAPGGMGKTRLSLETGAFFIRADEATHALPFACGVYFVPVAALSSPESIVTGLAEALEYRFLHDGRSQKQQLLDYLRDKPALLILDNFEHLLSGADIVSDILQHAPQVKVLATSRERLNLQEETVFRLEGMEVPAGEKPADVKNSTAVKLFVQGAKRTRADYMLYEKDIPAVAQICRLVEGLPLGLLLAAAWVEMLSVQEIAAEILRSFDFLEAELQNIPERQRSMQAVFDYSWGLIAEVERTVFRKLSVFRGSFSREAAQAVTGTSLRTLNILLNKSLIRRNLDSGLYDIHELLRQYAAEKLSASGEADATRDAHSQYYLNYLAQREADIQGRRQVESLHEIDLVFENIRAAWLWAVQQVHTDWLHPALIPLNIYGAIRNRSVDVGTLLYQARNHFAALSGGVSRRLYGRCIAFEALYTQKARQQLSEALIIARSSGHKHDLAMALLNTGEAMVFENKFAEALNPLQEAILLLRGLKDNYYLALALNRTGFCQILLGKDTAMKFIQESLEIARANGNYYQTAHTLGTVAASMLFAGDYDPACQLYAEARDNHSRLGDTFGVYFTSMTLGFIAMLQGDFAAARDLITQARSKAHEYQDDFTVPMCDYVLGWLAAAGEDYHTAWQLCEPIPAKHTHRADLIYLASAGHAMAACGLNTFVVARKTLNDALRAAGRLHAVGMMLWTLPVMTALLVHQNKTTEAAEVLSLALHHPRSPHGWLNQWAYVARLATDLETHLGTDGFTAAWERGKTLAIEAVVHRWLSGG